MLKLYLDNCCFNRPFDDQSQLIVRLESEAVVFIIGEIQKGNIDLVWSSVLDFENRKSPHEIRKESVNSHRRYAQQIIDVNDEVVQMAQGLQKNGLAVVDSLHVACAIASQCDHFLTTDNKILNKSIRQINILNPVQFIKMYEETQNE